MSRYCGCLGATVCEIGVALDEADVEARPARCLRAASCSRWCASRGADERRSPQPFQNCRALSAPRIASSVSSASGKSCGAGLLGAEESRACPSWCHHLALLISSEGRGGTPRPPSLHVPAQAEGVGPAHRIAHAGAGRLIAVVRHALELRARRGRCPPRWRSSSCGCRPAADACRRSGSRWRRAESSRSWSRDRWARAVPAPAPSRCSAR